jgi:hypothetical protein
MPSSLVVGALVVAWLVVLVPMVSRRREEVVRTGEAALAARVVHSGSGAAGFVSRGSSGARREAHRMPEREDEDVQDAVIQQETTELPLPAGDGLADAEVPEQARPERLGPRPYRPGRGGYDEQGAALQARAKYATRRRVVTGIVIAAALLAVLAALGPAALWWLQLLADVALVGYLGYLRRQVRIEEEIRRRRAGRLYALGEEEQDSEECREELAVQPGVRPFAEDAPPAAAHPGARMVRVDDDDPAFDELGDDAIPPYCPAVGQ